MNATTFWSIENGEIRRNEVQLSAERRAEIQNRIAEKYHAKPVKEPILCNHCHQREVEYRGRRCLKCAEMLAAAAFDSNADHQNMLIRLAVAILVIGIGIVLFTWMVK